MEQKFVTPLKVGLLAVVVSYFLFTLHAMFTLSWIGEWEGLPEPLSTSIFVTDVVAGTFLAFRFVASLIAISAMVLYFAKKGLPASTSNKLLRSVLVFEGLYWLGLLPSGIWGILPSNSGFNTSLLLSTGIPCMVSSIGIPVSLFILAWKLNPYRPPNQAIKWALVAGVLYAFVLWLNNTGMWVITVMGQGFGYLTAYPQYLLSFVLTVFGLLTIALFTVYFAKKSIGSYDVNQIGYRTVGGILLALGVYFLWNYLTWIYFGGWNEWYAWFLGHNLDLWLLSLPLVGLPLLFHDKNRQS